MRIKWLSDAESDTDNIVDHLDPVNPAAARRMIGQIEHAVETLLVHPLIGRQGRAPGTRELVVQRTPYIAVYSVEQDTIVIRRVLRSSRQWPPEDE